MLVLNDLHIGFRRTGGTTPASQEAMRTYLDHGIRDTLQDSDQDHLLIMGDLFDDYEVSSRDLLDAYTVLAEWLSDPSKTLTLVAGNHDWSNKGNRVSSFELLGEVLKSAYRGRVVVLGIDECSYDTERSHWYLSHCSNQDIFNAKLDEILAEVTTGDRVFLHANFDNNFAAQSDHSLNVTREQAKEFISKGATLVFAHEHQARTAMSGEVVVMGNQWPTSISDCLENDEKFAHVFLGSVKKIETWKRDAEAGFEVVPWELLADYPVDGGAGFIRVVGTATSNQASDVVNAIAKFRQKSIAFVITNAVKVDGITEAEDLPESFEAAKRFDVMDYIRGHLDADESAVVEELMKEVS